MKWGKTGPQSTKPCSDAASPEINLVPSAGFKLRAAQFSLRRKQNNPAMGQEKKKEKEKKRKCPDEHIPERCR